MECYRRGERVLDLVAMASAFAPLVWGVVALKSIGGLLVAATVKYTDNIVKSYATAVAILLTCIGTTIITGVVPSPRFLAGEWSSGSCCATRVLCLAGITLIHCPLPFPHDFHAGVGLVMGSIFMYNIPKAKKGQKQS